MTQQDKQLLIKDLSARLPYGVICACSFYNGQYNQQKKLLKIMSYTTNPYCVELDNGEYFPSAYMLDDIKPYLRPLSSMTKEEMDEMKEMCSIYIPTDSKNIGFEDYGILVFTHHLTDNSYSFKLNSNVVDWLNKNMFDYRGLIPMGHALEAPKDMYKI